MLRSALALLTAACCMATPASAYESLPRALADLTPASFASRVVVEDDPAASATVISTQQGYTRGRSLKGALADDVHLRAVIDRRTGAVTWQVWHDLAYTWGRKSLHAVLYRTGGTLHEARPFHVSYRPDRCPPTDGVGHCGSATKVGFTLSEDTVREIAANYSPGSRAPWLLQFKDENGGDVIGGLAPAEVAGLLWVVERSRSSRRSDGGQCGGVNRDLPSGLAAELIAAAPCRRISDQAFTEEQPIQRDAIRAQTPKFCRHDASPGRMILVAMRDASKRWCHLWMATALQGIN